MTTTREEFEARMHAECFQEPPSYCVDLAWAACQAAHLAGQRAMQERDALAAELKALREQEPVAWGDEPWMASFGVRVGRDSSNSIDLIFTTVGQRKFQLYAHEAAYLRGLLNKAEIPGYPNTHPAPARELTDAVDDLAQHIRQIDGNHSMGAGELAESIAEWADRYPKGEEE